MKLNLGCGNTKLDGFVNCDVQASCDPDRVVDLEKFPWPFEDSIAEEVVLSHVLEHLGESAKVYLGVIKELYRICAPNALVRIAVPHPRHDDFLTDPTHVRPILPEQFHMFSKRMNAEWRAGGFANTPLADYLDVDFEVEDVSWTVEGEWLRRLQSGEIDTAKLAEAARAQNNVLKEAKIMLRVKKG
jgi:predicted SAM-dependent methyltransferase